MTVLSIRMIGDPVLRTPAAPVPDLDRRTQELIADMFETMDAVSGIGLAAPQIGVSRRIFTFDVAGDRGAVINPELTLRGERALTAREPERGAAEGENLLREGCLSVAEIYAPVMRSQEVLLTGIGADGAPLQLQATGLLAACFQHEVDHLDGRLFVDRLTGEDKVAAARALRSRDYGQAIDQTLGSRKTSHSSFFAS
ncbi:peptide deformylase [Nesterenkonia sp. AN1]|uniref:peptide deformylase n=1 Tax=Nesterenkonia sp. AN1 TaxID=652017 RepID=UPI0004492416|nr:peptide deformylase [Nesterenkonia sp. AN1]EXF25174.1 peptide deformylase [Nesterenkonia sp. AN1]